MKFGARLRNPQPARPGRSPARGVIDHTEGAADYAHFPTQLTRSAFGIPGRPRVNPEQSGVIYWTYIFRPLQPPCLLPGRTST